MNVYGMAKIKIFFGLNGFKRNFLVSEMSMEANQVNVKSEYPYRLTSSYSRATLKCVMIEIHSCFEQSV